MEFRLLCPECGHDATVEAPDGPSFATICKGCMREWRIEQKASESPLGASYVMHPMDSSPDSG